MGRCITLVRESPYIRHVTPDQSGFMVNFSVTVRFYFVASRSIFANLYRPIACATELSAGIRNAIYGADVSSQVSSVTSSQNFKAIGPIFTSRSWLADGPHNVHRHKTGIATPRRR